MSTYASRRKVPCVFVFEDTALVPDQRSHALDHDKLCVQVEPFLLQPCIFKYDPSPP